MEVETLYRLGRNKPLDWNPLETKKETYLNILKKEISTSGKKKQKQQNNNSEQAPVANFSD